MDVFAQIENRVAAALEALKAEGALPADVPTSGIEVETPRDATHGDLATNAAMVLAKPARMKPRDIADKLQAKLAGVDGVEAVSVAGPGFLNLTLKPEVWHGLVRAILDEGAEYGRSTAGNGKKVNVEYVSANPDGTDARRPLPRRRVRRRARQPARLRRLRRHARILRQRCRRPGRRARAIRIPALPRGAGRGHRRDTAGALPRRLPEAGRRGAGDKSTASRSSTCRRTGGCRSCARSRSSR